ncbi:hypothetical protein BDN72DRAFT_849172 [Pluteus cervinus]|uniref:Uncharacterized protein n=1 Tax=Pluteus cervinus TaxID=181527 RepID=A0ACD3A8J4_9AGAR|nr:hypothetical protein BDN72DRAFT_849172 [Pluteus cervinus]
MSSVFDPQPMLDSKAIEQIRIDEQIISLLETVRKLRVKRNTLTPISVLPPELLLRIFKYVQQNKSTGWHYRWSAVTRVSQYWRTIAIAEKHLWSDIMFNTDWRTIGGGLDHKAAVNVFVQRSDPSLLEVCIVDKGFSDATSLLLGELSRIRLLSFCTDASHSGNSDNESIQMAGFVCTRLRDLLSRPAPYLEEICLTVALPDSVGPLRPVLRHDTPGVFLNGEAPRLTSLVIERMPFKLKGLICPRLTVLKVKFKHELPPSCRVPIDALLGLLCQANDLRILELDRAFFVSDNTDASCPNQPISLSSLKTFRLGANEAETRALLQKISLSPDIEINISIRTSASPATPNGPQALLDFLGNHLNHPVVGWNKVAIYAGDPSTRRWERSRVIVFAFGDGKNTSYDLHRPNAQRELSSQFERREWAGHESDDYDPIHSPQLWIDSKLVDGASFFPDQLRFTTQVRLSRSGIWGSGTKA